MYNQILLGPYCLCSTLLLGCKKCAAKVICSFSARCLWRAESCWIHFSCWYCDDFLFLLLYVFPSRQKWSWGGNLAPDTLFIQSHTLQRKVWTVHYTRLNLCRCIQQLHSNTPSSSLSSPPQIIWEQRSLQRLWSVYSSQWTGDEGTGQCVPSQGKVKFPLWSFELDEVGVLHSLKPLFCF